MMQGKDLVIYVGAHPIAASRSCDIDVRDAFRNVAGPDDSGWSRKKSGRKTWSVSVSVLVVSLTDGILHVGDLVRLSWLEGSGVNRQTGMALVTQCTVSGSKGHVSTGTFKFLGVGAIGPLSSQTILNPVPFLPMGDVIVGGRLFVYSDGVALAASKSCEIHCSTTTMETASDTDGDWSSSISDTKSWMVTTNHLVTTLGLDLLEVGKTVRLTFGVTNNGHITVDRLTGEALVSECKATGNVGHLAQGSFHFEGSGSLGQYVAQLYSNEPYKLYDDDGEALKAIWV